jgi:hypothetical protein
MRAEVRQATSSVCLRCYPHHGSAGRLPVNRFCTEETSLSFIVDDAVVSETDMPHGPIHGQADSGRMRVVRFAERQVQTTVVKACADIVRTNVPLQRVLQPASLRKHSPASVRGGTNQVKVESRHEDSDAAASGEESGQDVPGNAGYCYCEAVSAKAENWLSP